MNSTLKTTLAQKIVLTAIFAQNQLIFVFGGIQPNMNMEITRQMDIKNFIGTYELWYMRVMSHF